MRFGAAFSSPFRPFWLSPMVLAWSLGSLAPGWVSPVRGGDGNALVRIHGVEPGDLEVRGFEIPNDQVLRVLATDLESRSHQAELVSAWILDSVSRRVVWTMGDSKPIKAYRGFHDYEDNVRLRAGVYEVFFAAYPDDFEINEDEGWWSNASRALRRLAENELFGHEDYDEASERLRLVIEGLGHPLSQAELEQKRQALRRQAVVSLAPVGDNEAVENGFELTEPVELVIYALGELSRQKRFDYGWIVDTRTRRNVWTFDFDRSEPAGGGDKNRIVHQRVRLPAGRYGAFFRTDDSHSAEQWKTLPPRDPAFWGMTVWIRDAEQRSSVTRFQYQHLPKDRVLLQLIRVQDNQSVSRAMKLSEAADVRIYALGEGTPVGGMADQGWIVDARTREPVWSMDFKRTMHAGGAPKNRVIDEVVRLEAGPYIVSYATDGSHAFGRWNRKAPANGERWGITLIALDGFDPSLVQPYEEESDPSILARITRVGDDQNLSREVSLDVKSRVLIYAVGEGFKGQMYDYAWIEDASTGRLVWKMSLEDTRHAGGASKNRLYRGVLELEAGDYVVHYQSDDSHSFTEWNEKHPHDLEGWGVRLVLLDQD